MIDLHSHTTASDGTLAPEELLRAAVTAGLRALAITDHDTLAGFQQASRAVPAGLTLIPGVELSTLRAEESAPAWRQIHLLGYFPGGCPPDFLQWLEEVRLQRRERNRLMAERLQRLGIAITCTELEALAGGVPGRPHMAQLLISKGYCQTLRECFDRYLGEGGMAYVERADVATPEGIARIGGSGGVPVLAHPIRSIRPEEDLRAVLADWQRSGLAGVEVWHCSQPPAYQETVLAAAGALGLLATGGSDFHGDNSPGGRLGWGREGEARVPDPDSVLEQLYARASYTQS